MQKVQILSYLLLLIALSHFSCSKKTGCKDPLSLDFDPEAEVANGTCTYPQFSLDLSYTMGNLPFEINRIYTLDSSIVAFQSLHFYLSGFQLTREDQSKLDFEEVYILEDGLATSNQQIGEVGVERYQSFSCFLGVDEKTNKQLNANLSNKPESHPLAAQTPAMHWTNPKEYIFLRIKGKVDINGDGIPSDNEIFTYEIGTKDLLQTLNFTINKKFDLAQNTIALEVDVEQLVKGVDIKTENATHSTDDFALASKIANNVQQAVRLK